MNRLTLFLDWLDNAAGGMIRLAYLAAGITAIAVYFGAGHLPTVIEDPLNAALPWALAFAVETHTYITARRVRAAWQEKSWGALKVNIWILAFLLAFSAWNQLGYLSETWHPPIGALALPGWLAYLVRALVIPAAFMAAAFLAPMAEPIAAQIEAEARSVLADVFKIARKQRRRMLKSAEREGRDMTGALVELVSDPETRRIISHAYGAIGAPVSAMQTMDVSAPPPQPVRIAPDEATGPLEQPAASAAEEQPPNGKPPTGPGSPARKRGARTGVITPTSDDASNVTQLPTQRRRSRGRTAASGRGSGRKVRASVEEKARAHFTLGMSASELARTAHIGKSAASKYRTSLTIEALQAQQAAQ